MVLAEELARIDVTESAFLRLLRGPDAGGRRSGTARGMRTTTFKKRTLIAYEVDESAGVLVVKPLGVFHGGQDGEPALRDE